MCIYTKYTMYIYKGVCIRGTCVYVCVCVCVCKAAGSRNQQVTLLTSRLIRRRAPSKAPSKASQAANKAVKLVSS